MSTILELINSARSEMTFLERSSIANSSDVDDKQLLAVANRTAKYIRDFYDWEVLRTTKQYTMTAATAYDLPDDFRAYVSDSAWHDQGSRKVELPVADNRWYAYKFSAFSTAGIIRARLKGTQLIVLEPNAGEVIDLEYVSKYVVQAADASYKENFSVDTDTFVLDDELFIAGFKAKWSLAKSLEQAGAWDMEFNNMLGMSIGRDAGGRIIGGSDTDRTNRFAPYYPLYRT